MVTVEELLEKYSDFLVDKEGNKCKIECKAGWFGLIDELCEKLDNIDLVKELKCDVKIKSISEKFGLMRTSFVMTKNDIVDLKLSSISHAFENKSSMICSMCGAPAKPYQDRNRALTLCAKCLKEVLA